MIATGIFWYPNTSGVWQLGQYRRSPRHWLSLVSCAISFPLCSISATNPARFLSLHSRCLFLLFQIQIREIARRTVTLRLENSRSRWPFGYRFEIPNSMDAAKEMITLHLGCAKEVNKNEEDGRRWWRKRREMEKRERERQSVMYLIVESLPGLDLQ